MVRVCVCACVRVCVCACVGGSRRKVQEERYEDAAELQMEIEIETAGRADVTQDPGSYDPFLDADDWYMRDLIKSKKRGHQ